MSVSGSNAASTNKNEGEDESESENENGNGNGSMYLNNSLDPVLSPLRPKGKATATATASTTQPDSYHCSKYRNNIIQRSGHVKNIAPMGKSVLYPLFLILASGSIFFCPDGLLTYSYSLIVLTLFYLVPLYFFLHYFLLLYLHYFTSVCSSNYINGIRITKLILAYDILCNCLNADGLWDFLSGAEATDLVCEFLLTQIIEQPPNRSNTHRKGGKKGRKRQRCESGSKEGGDEGTVDVEDKVEAEEEEEVENVVGFKSYLQHSAMHDAARLLALEAYVRGSMDNVGVCVVDLLPYL